MYMSEKLAHESIRNAIQCCIVWQRQYLYHQYINPYKHSFRYFKGHKGVHIEYTLTIQIFSVKRLPDYK